MTRRRWIADEVSGNRAVLTGQNALHLARVLRARVGQQFDICHDRSVRVGKIIAIHEDRVELELGDEVTGLADFESDVTLLIAVFKFDRIEWAIEKATELGITRILPVIAQRTDAHLATAASKRLERWRKIAHEAAQQSRRTAEPEIAEAKKLKSALTEVPATNTGIILNETEKSITLAQVISSIAADAAVVLAIGPEGGWTGDELELFSKSGWKPASLGPTILRAETAAIAAIAIVRALR